MNSKVNPSTSEMVIVQLPGNENESSMPYHSIAGDDLGLDFELGEDVLSMTSILSLPTAAFDPRRVTMESPTVDLDQGRMTPAWKKRVGGVLQVDPKEKVSEWKEKKQR